jgi:hypothetical protein
VDVEVNSLYVKRINIEDLMDYICIIKVDTGLFVMITMQQIPSTSRGERERSLA